jgi:alpha-D-xyloside xylohydrolase
MPVWSTGFIQCKDRYRNQTQVMDVARGYVERGLPISMIVIDWFHWTEMGDMGLNPECWPDPQAMVDELRMLGIELMITFWPFVGLPYDNGTAVSRHWDEFNNQGFLANSTTTGKPESFWRYSTPTGNAVIDSTNPAAMKAVTDHWWEGYGKYGVRAVWMDEAEPDHAAYISGGQWDLHAGSDGEVLPAWVHYWAQGFADKFREIGDDYFILSRNAWSGTWSNGAALWSGDIGSHWSDLQTAVFAGQQAGVSGIPLWTTDIGGYGGGNPDTPYFQELIVRWFQFGAFSPLFRLHGHRGGKSAPPSNQCGPTNGDNEVWNLAKDPEHYAAIEKVMMLREDLRNYVKQINDQSVATGVPMMRPMFFQFPDDPVCAGNQAEKQFMLGPDWLISPVTASNATTWPAYLPKLDAQHEWVYWWNQTVVKGPGWINIDTTAIADFPLFLSRPVQPVVE